MYLYIYIMYTGPDWHSGDEDGGHGCIGTVKVVYVEGNADNFNPGVVSVLWDRSEDGETKPYRMGYDDAFDLQVERRPCASDSLAWSFSSLNPASGKAISPCAHRTSNARCAVMFPEVTEDGRKSIKRVACSPDVAGVAALGFVVDFDQRTLSFFLVIWKSGAGIPLLVPAARVLALRMFVGVRTVCVRWFGLDSSTLCSVPANEQNRKLLAECPLLQDVSQLFLYVRIRSRIHQASRIEVLPWDGMVSRRYLT